MGNDISMQFRLTDIGPVPVTFNDLSRSPTKIRESPQSPNVSVSKQVNSKLGVAQINDTTTKRAQQPSGDKTSILDSPEVEQNTPESQIKNLITEYLQVDSNEQGEDMQTKLGQSSYEQDYEKKLKSIHQTLRSLDDSLRDSRGLETEKSFQYSQLKTKNIILQIDLDKAKKQNKNMLNLFRQNAAEIGFGRLRTSSTLPESLRKDIQRIWSHKYDALLEQNNQLKKEAADAGFALKNKEKENADLQHRLLNLAEDLIQREKTIEKICTKFILLKQRKDEQEILLRGSLKNALHTAKSNVSPSKSNSCMIPCKDALIAREVRRSDRLAYENIRLKALLQEVKRSCRSSRTSSTISLYDKRS